MQTLAERLATHLSLGGVLDELKQTFGTYELVDHFTQGEFHHDVVLRLPPEDANAVVVVATNCNGGVKEVLCFDSTPEHGALWHWRCPSNPEFTGDLPPLRARVVTEHWFDPCELLRDDARSELRPECRVRQPGGGWQQR